MIDIHNHILPNIDDGSQSMSMSIDMLKNAFNQGITDVVNTVHYQHPKVEGLDLSYERLNNKVVELQNNINQLGLPIKIHLGAEVFFLPNLIEIIDNPITTFGNKKYMLIEFMPNYIPEIYKKIFFDLKMAGITPIIAHPERYKPVQKDINLVLQWLNLGCLIQVDAGSILGGLGNSAKKISEIIIKQNWCQIISSDAHDNKKRNFLLSDALSLAIDWIGNDATFLVNEHPKCILEGKSINIDFNNNEIKSSFWDSLMINKD